MPELDPTTVKVAADSGTGFSRTAVDCSSAVPMRALDFAVDCAAAELARRAMTVEERIVMNE